MKYKLSLLLLFIIFVGADLHRAATPSQVRWDDIIRVTPNAVQVNPATSKPDYDIFLGNTKTLLFDPAAVECVTFSAQVPHRWKLATSLSPHVHWSPTTTNTGTVIWSLEYTLIDINGVFSAPGAAIQSTAQAGAGVAYTHQYVDLPDISMASFTNRNDVSIMILARLCREATSDSYTGDAALLEFDFHGQIDDQGSQEEGLK